VSEYRFEVSQENEGSRLDLFLSRMSLELSRNQVQRLIDNKSILVNEKPQKASYRLRSNDQVLVSVPPPPPLVYKEYSALVYGHLRQSSGEFTDPIRRHPKSRKKMGIIAGGREASTFWWLELLFGEVSLVKVVIKTGRTHQIRVHFAHARHPVVGDATYGGKKRVKSVQNPLLRARLSKVKRQMLHARRLALEHPATGETLDLSSPLPADMSDLLQFLREYDQSAFE